MKENDIEKIIKLCQIELERGTDLQTVICYLKAINVSIVDAFKILRKAKGINLGEAKRLVTSNKCWDDEAKNMMELSDQLLKELESNYNLKIDSGSFEITFDLDD